MPNAFSSHGCGAKFCVRGNLHALNIGRVAGGRRVRIYQHGT